MFNLEHGYYAASNDGEDGDDLYYSVNQAGIDNFDNILGLEIPGMNSTFVYGVYYDPAKIYVRVREHFTDWDILCHKEIEGPNKGNWRVYGTHPWAKYFREP